MKRILILIFFALELVAVFTGGKVSVGIIAVSAQNMGNESTLPYECDGIPSNIPCDEVEICPCPYCDYSDDCDEIDFHVSVMHGNEGERPTDPDAPWDGGEYPDWNDGNWGSGNFPWNPGGNTGSNTGNSDNVVVIQPDPDIQQGEQTFNKIKTDIENGNVAIYSAEIIDEGTLNNIHDGTSTTLTAFSTSDYVSQQISNLASYDTYIKLSKAVSNLGVIGDFLSTGVIVITKSYKDYTIGDIATFLSAGLGIAGLVITTGPFAPAIGAASAIVGVICIFTSHNEILYYKLPNGKLLKLKPITT